MTLTSTKPIQKETIRGNGAGPPPLGTTQLDEALAMLQAHKDAWVATGIAERIALLAEIRRRMAAIGERWVATILAAKGTTNDAFGSGEEWANYALVLRWMRLLHGALCDIEHTGHPLFWPVALGRGAGQWHRRHPVGHGHGQQRADVGGGGEDRVQRTVPQADRSVHRALPPGGGLWPQDGRFRWNRRMAPAAQPGVDVRTLLATG